MNPNMKHERFPKGVCIGHGGIKCPCCASLGAKREANRAARRNAKRAIRKGTDV